MVVTSLNTYPMSGVPNCYLVTGVEGALSVRVNGGVIPASVNRTSEGWLLCFVPPKSGTYTLEISTSKGQVALTRTYVF